MLIWRLFGIALVLLAGGCSHDAGAVRNEADSPRKSRVAYDECNSVSARINVLIANGQFAEATAAGLISKPQAVQKLQEIALLSTRVGQLPASLQRVKDFPTQLRDFTLFEIKQMLQNRDFRLATETQLKMVKKLLDDPERVMDKMGTVR